MAWVDDCAWVGVSGGSALCLEQPVQSGLSPGWRHEQFFHLHSDGNAWTSSCGRDFGADFLEYCWNSVLSGGNSAHRDRHYFLVLALHDWIVDLHSGVVLIRGAVKSFLAAGLLFGTGTPSPPSLKESSS